MKICRIIAAYSPHSFGGADICAEKISRALVKKGNPTVVISIATRRKDSYEKDDGTTIYRFHPLNVSTMHKIGKQPLLRQGVWTLFDIYSFYSFYKIRDILRKENPDIVHLHTPIDVTLSAFDAVKSLGLPLVYTIHDYLLLCRRVTLLHINGNVCNKRNINPLCKLYQEFSKKIVNRNIDLVISPSEFSLKLYEENGFFVNTEKIILPHGINLELHQDHERPIVKEQKPTFDILYAGGLTRHKGIHVLIQALRMIPNSNIRLYIVGGGVYEKKLKAAAIGDKRIIFQGKFTNKEMAQFYRNADVLVVPSIWYDVRPNVILEAFRDGLPVIGSNIGGIPELIEENKTGFLFKSGDANDLKRILEVIIKNPQMLSSMGKNCLEFVKQFEMEQYLNKLLAIYRQVININHNRKCYNYSQK